ncbi:MAG TPA: Xaa-Pro peptidase family protein [Gemmataceae bacterium]|nr:Xaa-Pro peptidase family protein [Gemmataceae bacterium]
MLTADGCRARRERLWAALPELDVPALVLADPLHLRYLANFFVDPISLGGDFGGLLVLRRDGHAAVYHDRRLPPSVNAAHVDERVEVPWYDGQTPGTGPRRLALLAAVERAGGRIHDALADPLGPTVIAAVERLRRRKDPDEIDVLRSCARAAEAGHAWARRGVRPGMTELDAYSGISAACTAAAERPVIVYGDFAVSPGPARRGGPPTPRVLRPGDMLILDFSVVLDGYRCDFTNTLAVGGRPTSEQRRLFGACRSALAAAERQLRAGTRCQAVYDAVREAFAAAGLADHFPHHAGHGLGLAHPESPYFVRHSTEDLVAGDVVAVEPGLYVEGVGGIRIEHNYAITADGFDRLSSHELALT